jgi:hypothetical protein
MDNDIHSKGHIAQLLITVPASVSIPWCRTTPSTSLAKPRVIEALIDRYLNSATICTVLLPHLDLIPRVRALVIPQDIRFIGYSTAESPLLVGVALAKPFLVGLVAYGSTMSVLLENG